jgi:DNA methylase
VKTHLALELSHREELPDALKDDDVRYPESLVEYFLQEYTQVGDTILDPFAGYGTALIVAERQGRVPFGVELSEEKVNLRTTPQSYEAGRDSRAGSRQSEAQRAGDDLGLGCSAVSITGAALRRRSSRMPG